MHTSRQAPVYTTRVHHYAEGSPGHGSPMRMPRQPRKPARPPRGPKPTAAGRWGCPPPVQPRPAGTRATHNSTGGYHVRYHVPCYVRCHQGDRHHERKQAVQLGKRHRRPSAACPVHQLLGRLLTCFQVGCRQAGH